jgi:hypothetical protein
LCYRGRFAAFVAIHGCLGSLHVTGRPRLNFHKTKHIGTPADQVDFSRVPRSAVVAGADNVARAAKMESRRHLPAPAGALMRRPLVGRQSMPRQPVEAADGSVGEAAGEQVWAPGYEWDAVIPRNLLPRNEKRV